MLGHKGMLRPNGRHVDGTCRVLMASARLACHPPDAAPFRCGLARTRSGAGMLEAKRYFILLMHRPVQADRLLPLHCIHCECRGGRLRRIIVDGRDSFDCSIDPSSHLHHHRQPFSSAVWSGEPFRYPSGGYADSCALSSASHTMNNCLYLLLRVPPLLGISAITTRPSQQ